MGVASVLFTIQTAVLVAASLLMLYPVLAYAHNVAYTRELQLLSASFVLLACAYVGGVTLESPLVSNVFDLLSALTAFLAMWRLAARFTATDSDGDTVAFEATRESVEGGFRGGD